MAKVNVNNALQKQIKDVLTDKEAIKVIASSKLVFQFAKEKNVEVGADESLVKVLKKRYTGLDLDSLLLLYLDAYHSVMAAKDSSAGEINACSETVKHKVLALGIIITDKYLKKSGG